MEEFWTNDALWKNDRSFLYLYFFSFILLPDQFNTGTIFAYTIVDIVVKLCGNPVTT